ncbi:MAG: glycine zipper 2TM domain-containing protein [Hydrogenophilaceae bacterium]|nr:glycine zipper 2TM domain-containing protein [Hydrogenophilaceae bacterium]
MTKRILILPLIALALTGCAGSLGGSDYERSETRRAYEVKMGVVESVRSVSLEGTQSGVGIATGAVVGGVVGSEVGEGKGKTLATVIGAVAGGIAGAAAEKGITKKPGLEITVRLDSGRTLAVIQEDTGERFSVGERVRILESGGQTRVSH